LVLESIAAGGSKSLLERVKSAVSPMGPGYYEKKSNQRPDNEKTMW
jgi:hypothetical protein